jgi:16S rRNA (cytosine967-C5)-methyltransferase
MAMAGVSAARNAAFSILLRVEQGAGHSDDLLRGQAVSNLSAADRHLATALVLGVLRWQILLDARLRSFLARPNAKLETEVQVALRLGAFQLLHLDRIPARAAIDESVELAKKSGHRFASRMVNAVLRKLAQAARDDSIDGGTKGTGSSPYLPVVQDVGALAPEGDYAVAAHPVWMVKRWTAFFGDDTTCAICRHNQEQPLLTVRLAAPEVATELAQAGITFESGRLLASARSVSSGDVAATAAFREGPARIQDEGSQLVAEIAALAAPDGSKPGRILDACAAPGGKTLILAERNSAARIVACEANPKRLESLRERLAPFGDRIECRLADATALTFVSEYDVVLADVPCSGTGTLGRNPEIRHRLRPEDLSRQAGRQQAILSSALRAVRPGGRVIYSTCSLEPEENEQVIDAVLAQNQHAGVVSTGSTLDKLRDRGIITEEGTQCLTNCVSPEGFLRLIPGAFGTDGFFIAMIEKKN